MSDSGLHQQENDDFPLVGSYENETKTGTKTTLMGLILVPFVYLALFWEIVTSPLNNLLKTILTYLDYVPVPVFNPKAIFIWKSPISFTTASTVNFRYWFTLLCLFHIIYGNDIYHLFFYCLLDRKRTTLRGYTIFMKITVYFHMNKSYEISFDYKIISIHTQDQISNIMLSRSKKSTEKYSFCGNNQHNYLPQPQRQSLSHHNNKISLKQLRQSRIQR